MTEPAPVHREIVVDPGCAARMARVAVRYRLTRPEYLAVLGAEVLAGVVLLLTGPTWLGGVFVAAVAVQLLLIPVQIRRLETSLRVRGFAPDTTVAVDFYPDRFVVTTPTVQATHPLSDVRSALATDTAVALKMRRANFLVLLPTELVPPEVRPSLTATRRAARRP
jgi:hypothetical protein